MHAAWQTMAAQIFFSASSFCRLRSLRGSSKIEILETASGHVIY